MVWFFALEFLKNWLSVLSCLELELAELAILIDYKQIWNDIVYNSHMQY